MKSFLEKHGREFKVGLDDLNNLLDCEIDRPRCRKFLALLFEHVGGFSHIRNEYVLAFELLKKLVIFGRLDDLESALSHKHIAGILVDGQYWSWWVRTMPPHLREGAAVASRLKSTDELMMSDFLPYLAYVAFKEGDVSLDGYYRMAVLLSLQFKRTSIRHELWLRFASFLTEVEREYHGYCDGMLANYLRELQIFEADEGEGVMFLGGYVELVACNSKLLNDYLDIAVHSHDRVSTEYVMKLADREYWDAQKEEFFMMFIKGTNMRKDWLFRIALCCWLSFKESPRHLIDFFGDLIGKHGGRGKKVEARLERAILELEAKQEEIKVTGPMEAENDKRKRASGLPLNAWVLKKKPRTEVRLPK
jgi:hypothetical protein